MKFVSWNAVELYLGKLLANISPHDILNYSSFFSSFCSPEHPNLDIKDLVREFHLIRGKK